MKDKNVCKDLTFNDCELAILRMAVDRAEEKMAKRIVNSDDIKRIIHIVENFIKIKNLSEFSNILSNFGNFIILSNKFFS